MPNGLPYPMIDTGVVAYDNTGAGGQVPFTNINLLLSKYVQTAGEIAAGITPTNYQYPPGMVDRYFTNTIPGSTSAVQAFNNAITVSLLSQGTCSVTYGLTGCYLLDSPVNGTWGGNVGGAWVPNLFSPGLTIVNLGPVGIDNIDPSAPFTGLYVKHNGVCAFDFTGADYVTLINPVITTNSSVFPKVGILGSRAIVPLPGPPFSEAIGGCITIRGGRITGKFGIAPYYNYAIEADSIIQMYIANFNTAANTSVIVVTASNYYKGTANAVLTPFTTDALGQPLTQATGSQSCTIHQYTANQHSIYAEQNTADTFYFEGAQSVSLGGWAYAGGSRSIVYFDGTNAASNNFDMTDLSCESSAGEPSYGVMYSNNAQSYAYHRLRPRKLAAATQAVYSPNTGTSLSHFDIGDLHDADGSGVGLSIAGTLSLSTADTGYAMSIGTSQQNLLIGDPTLWTFTRNFRSKDRWISKSATTTFAPGITNANGWTVSGLTQTGNFEFTERSVKFSIVLTTTGDIAWGIGATITTLPGVAIGTFACEVIDATTGAVLSAGIITATPLTLPLGSPLTFPFGNSTLTLPVAHTTSSDSIIIQGSYLVA